MLSQLYIENLAVIKNAEINFTKGFNIFTGETGAGKTILVTAIGGILGGKLSKDTVRTGEDKAVIMATFEDLSPEIIAFADDLGYDISNQLLVSREINSDGKSSCRINGRPATLSILKEITQQIVDIHGQQDSNSLISPSKQLSLIDDFGDYRKDINQYEQLYNDLTDLKKQISELSLNDSEKAQKIDILTYQIQEIEEAQLQIGEDDELINQRNFIQNSQEIIDGLAQANDLLSEENNVCDQLGLLIDIIGKLEEYLPDLKDKSEAYQETFYELKELSSIMRDQMESMDFDPREMDRVEDRLDKIYKLKRKYGQSIEEILEFYNKACEELNSISYSSDKLDKLNEKYDNCLSKLTVKAKTITSHRTASAKAFVKSVETELKFLDMPSVKLTIDISPKEFTITGADKLAILISVNPGEPPKPISKIASGGEISRIMLAVKNVMAGKDDIATMIFDEVDTGVSGKAAVKIGSKLKECAANRQVICVTHLAQVAAYGDGHFKIEKNISSNRTFTTVTTLEGGDRVEEIARIMVGDNITDNSIISAKELLENSK